MCYQYKELVSTLRYMTFFSLNPQELDRSLFPYMPKIKAYRDEVYNKVVSEGTASGRWTSEQSLYRLVKRCFEDAIYQYRAEWLGAQSIDIFIPSIQVGIEYQGIQHYEAVNLFGGAEALKQRKQLDAKKKKLCKSRGVTLIEWKYTKEINQDAVIACLYEWYRKKS